MRVFLNGHYSLCFPILLLLASWKEVSGKIFYAEITEIPGTSSGVTGSVYVFQPDESGIIGYAGTSFGLAPGLLAATCTAVNGCGAHIHSGSSCADSPSQGGHLFFPPMAIDPWVDERYDSDGDGVATYSGILDMGFGDLNGRAFLIHAEDGTRLGCGLLSMVPPDEVLIADLTPIAGVSLSNVIGNVNIVTPDEESVCFYGTGENLEPNLLSGVMGGPGEDCTSSNGCGAHIHAGFSCLNSETQLGHLYDSETLSADPWAFVHYESTDEFGNGAFIGCLELGEFELTGRAFIIHAEDGSRVSCGLLEPARDIAPIC